MERVLVVDRSVLFGDHAPQGFVSAAAEPQKARLWIELIKTDGYFAPRPSVEDDPSRKQIIPYCVVTDGVRIFLLKRLKGGGERRLHHLYSVGVGGHINEIDQTAANSDVLLRGARRELLEEISLDAAAPMDIVGFVNDDSNQVGSVHFGVVFRVSCMDAKPVVLETSQLEGEMVPWVEVTSLLSHEPDSFETWSRIVIQGWGSVREEGPNET